MNINEIHWKSMKIIKKTMKQIKRITKQDENTLEINEIQRKSMKFIENQWKSSTINENHKKSMKINEMHWKSINIFQNRLWYLSAAEWPHSHLGGLMANLQHFKYPHCNQLNSSMSSTQVVGLLVPQLVKNSSNICPILSDIGPRWLDLVQDGRIWSQMVGFSPRWSDLIQNCWIWFQKW